MYHVKVVLCVCPSLQVPNEDVPIVAGRQDDAGVKGVWLQDKHLGLMALKAMFRLVICQLWRLNEVVVISTTLYVLPRGTKNGAQLL